MVILIEVKNTVREDDEVYRSIDNNEITDKDPLSELLRKGLQYYKETNENELAEKCSWDLMLIDLVIDEEKKHSSFKGKPFSPQWVGANGYIYPDPDGIPEEALGYYDQRLKETKNILLLALYNDYLWYRRGDHYKARAAIEYYLEIGKALQAKGEYLDSFEYLFKPISISRSLRDDPLFRICIDNLFTTLTDVSNRRDFRWVIEPAEKVLDYYNRLEPSQKESLIRILESAADGYKTDNPDNLHIYRSIQNLVETGYRKLQNADKAKATGRLIAKSFEEEAFAKTNGYKEHAFVGSVFLTNAIKKYQQCGGPKEKVDELLKTIKDLNNVAAGEMKKTRFDTGISVEDIEKMVEPHRRAPLAANIEFLIYEPRILPSWQEELDKAKKTSERYIGWRLFPQIIYDAEGNEVARAYSDEEKIEYNAVRLGVLLHYQLNYLFLKKLLDLLIEQGLTQNHLIAEIAKAPIIKAERLPLISFALERYFSGDDISFIHIAVFQIEGILRDVLKILGLPTSKIVRERGFQERTLNDILEEPAICEALGRRVYPLVRFVLADQRGYNIRNYVAHGLFPFDAFNDYISILLLLIILRFCGYELKGEANGAVEDVRKYYEEED